MTSPEKLGIVSEKSARKTMLKNTVGDTPPPSSNWKVEK